MERILGYVHKCRILRQIQSNKARKYGLINTWQNIATVVVSAFLTFIGFSGIDKIHTYLNWAIAVDRPKVEFAFNFLVFILFVLVILHLVFQFGRKQAQSERAIVSLTNLINYIEDLVASARPSGNLSGSEQKIIRQRYAMVTEVIPPNTDKEFIKAKKDFQNKEAKRIALLTGPTELFDETRLRAVVESLVRESGQGINILTTLRDVDGRLFLGGGIVRNLVWDYLHGYKSPTPIEDVDVIYFDTLSNLKEHDLVLEKKLEEVVPNYRWSVKNQARMHISNEEEPYQCIEDALSKWPETATAIAVRLSSEDQLEFVAPYGYSDLFRLLVSPTPHFRNKLHKYRERLAKKEWAKVWPKLRFIDTKEKDKE